MKGMSLNNSNSKKKRKKKEISLRSYSCVEGYIRSMVIGSSKDSTLVSMNTNFPNLLLSLEVLKLQHETLFKKG